MKIGAGIVKQYMFMSENGGENDTFFHEQLAQISAKVLAAVDAPQPNRDDSDDFFCHENAFLNPSIRPEGFSQPTQHFTVCEDATNKEDDHDGKKSRVCMFWTMGLLQIPAFVIVRTHNSAQAAAASSSDGATIVARVHVVISSVATHACVSCQGPAASSTQETHDGAVRDPPQGRRWPIQAPAQPHFHDRH